MTQDRKPNWEWWGNVDEVTVIEAVALSMDIDPNKLHYRKPPGTMAVEVRDESPEFEKRFSLAIRNLKVLEAWGNDVVGELKYCLVKQAKFAAVALSWNWKIPPRMAAWAEPDKRDAKILNLKQQVEALTQERDKWHVGREHYTEKLSVLIQAANRFWKGANRDEQDTWKENPEVAAWLMEKGFGSTLARRAVTIIRPKWAPMGRKRKRIGTH